ncbi:MAG: general secretion pathway protein GspB, partial [Thalassotalea sp.]|nr:general secretion pathway protein GspB [Thalassotalea sp.]
MSYILDALKKDQKSISTLDFNDDTSDDKSSDDSAHNYVLLISKIIVLILLAILLGFYLGGGQKVLEHHFSQTKNANLATVDRVGAEQALDSNVTPVDTNVHEYFSAVDDYNKQLIANKKFAEMQRQQVAQEQYQLEQKQQQELLAKQVEKALADTGMMNQFGSNARKSPLEPAQKTKEPVKLTLNQDELQGVSPELLLAFQTALDDSNSVSETDKQTEQFDNTEDSSSLHEEVKPLGQMPTWYQDSLPTLHFTLHMYSSSPQDSWLRLNGKDYYSGEQTDEGLIIEKIMPQKLILEYQGERFSMKALTNW